MLSRWVFLLGASWKGGKGGRKDVQLRLDTLGRRDSQQALSNTSREARHCRAGSRNLAICVREQPLVLIECDESCCPSSAQYVLSHPIGPACASSLQRGKDTSTRKRTDPGLGRVADDERRAPSVPLRSERWPRQLLALGQPAVELCSCLGDCSRQKESRLVSISLPIA